MATAAYTFYKNISGNSGVIRYAIYPDAIAIVFKDSDKEYVYSNRVTGDNIVVGLKNLALIGRGLATFISRNQKTLLFTVRR